MFEKSGSMQKIAFALACLVAGLSNFACEADEEVGPERDEVDSDPRAAAPPDTPACDTAELVPSRVIAAWVDVPTDDAVANVVDGKLRLRVSNVSKAVVNVTVRFRFNVGGKRLLVSGTGSSVAAATTVTRNVDVTTFGIDLSALRASGHVTGEVEVVDGRGQLLEHSYSPILYFHAELPAGSTREPVIVAYGERAMQEVFAAGQLGSIIHEAAPNERLLATIDGTAGEGTLEEGGP